MVKNQSLQHEIGWHTQKLGYAFNILNRKDDVNNNNIITFVGLIKYYFRTLNESHQLTLNILQSI